MYGHTERMRLLHLRDLLVKLIHVLYDSKEEYKGYLSDIDTQIDYLGKQVDEVQIKLDKLNGG